jgi:hypothetical protein
MKKQHLNIIAGFVLTSMVALWGCEPELVTTIKLPEEDPKLVINAYMITGQEVNSIFLGRSIPNNSPNDGFPWVENGTVTISDGVNQIPLTHIENGYYEFDPLAMSILPGKTFTIRASAPGFKKEVSSTCTVPADFSPTLETTRLDSAKGTQMKSYSLYFKFRDIAGTKDFYRVEVEAICIDTMYQDTAYISMYAPQSQPVLFKDEGKDGEWFPFRFTADLYHMEGENLYMVGYKISIIRTDEHYYKFHYPFLVQGYYDDNPFGEPTIIYSNIINGYGVFAGGVKKSILVFL